MDNKEHKVGLHMLKNIIATFKKSTKMIYSFNKTFTIFIVASTIVQGILPAISMLIMQNIINMLQNSNKNLKELFILTGLYLSIDLILTFLSTITGYFSAKFEMNFTMDLNTKIFEKAAELDLKDFEDTETYNKINRAQNESSGKITSYFMTFISIAKQVVSMVSSVLILLTFKVWLVGVIVIIPIIKYFYLLKVNQIQFLIRKNRTNKERKAWYMGHIITNGNAFKEIKLYGLKNYFIKRYRELTTGFIIQDTMILKRASVFSLIFDVFDQLIGGGVFSYIVFNAYIGNIMIGNTITYIKCVFNIKSNVESILNSFVSISKNTLFINLLFEFLEIDTRTNYNSIESKEIDELKEIEIRNLYYRYKNSDKYVLRDVNIKISKNDIIALVGKNGSGKTTLIKILSGFYDDYEGEIYINGIDLRSIDKQSIMKKIGILFQDFVRYEATIRENVAFGDMKSINNDNIIQDMLNRAGIDRKLYNNCHGLDTQLGFWFDNGKQLSIGEWQKVALARAFIRDAELYILDEPNASLDAVAEYEILKKYYKMMQNKIGIIITHRLSNIKNFASKIIVLDDGMIVGFGAHDELMSNNGIYRELYEKQFIEDNLNWGDAYG